jgi:L-ribulokinase
MRHAVGLDFGTLSARALVVEIDSGDSISFEHEYAHGTMEDPDRPDVARQNAQDYLVACAYLLKKASEVSGNIVGIGVDATASTPVPVDAELMPLSESIPSELNANAWLWKDTSSHEEADEINAVFSQQDPCVLARVGKYYPEWFWAKLLHCARETPRVFDSANTWLEQGDFVCSSLTGGVTRGVCAAGHKALYVKHYPRPETLDKLDPKLGTLVSSFGGALPSSARAGGLSEEWAERTGIAAGTPVAVSSVDAHSGAVGAGVARGRVCMVLGTSACHIAVAPYSAGIESIPGISGVANDSVIPGMLGIEAGQAAFGELLEWTAKQLGEGQDALSREAESAPPGSNGVLIIDFHNGNRCPFADSRLTGITVGQTLITTRAEIYRATVEALAMGTRQILGTFANAGVTVNDLIACGGVAEKSDFVLQTIADVTGLEVRRSASAETCALGAAIYGTVAAGAFPSVEEAQALFCRTEPTTFVPRKEANAVYDQLFPIWLEAQRAFATDGLLKRLIDLREAIR